MNKQTLFAAAIILIATLFSSNKISAQWSQNATSIWNTTSTLNLGIGTNTPTKKLQVNGGDGLSLGFGANVTGEGIGSKRSASGNQWGLDFYTNTLSRMSITNAGNVGIGTTTPTIKFQVNVASGIALGFGEGVTGEGIGSKRTVAGNQWGLDFYTNSSNRMIITNAGKVGIGISEPELMPGSYKLYVADGILTEKVKVALKYSANWADYVFAADYKLRSLNEVEQYVLENKHLPGVPSAEEVQKTGIDVATMDAKLLEKIEELTLYMIDMKKENEALKARLTALESKK